MRPRQIMPVAVSPDELVQLANLVVRALSNELEALALRLFELASKRSEIREQPLELMTSLRVLGHWVVRRA
jgi:hypothetical protein